jgi:hypothetical protein
MDVSLNKLDYSIDLSLHKQTKVTFHFDGNTPSGHMIVIKKFDLGVGFWVVTPHWCTRDSYTKMCDCEPDPLYLSCKCGLPLVKTGSKDTVIIRVERIA